MDPFGGADGDLFEVFAESGKTARPRPASEGEERSAKRLKVAKSTSKEDVKQTPASTTPSPSPSSSSNSSDEKMDTNEKEGKGTSLRSAMRKKKTTAEEEEGDYSFAEFAEQIVEPLEVTGARCSAEVCYPPHWDFDKAKEDAKKRVPKAKPAKEYPFVLDAFQRESVRCIETNQSVLVSAHTSAGKTVVAEYAIATALRDGQRVIYTSPIKALSNQKYRELYDEFQDVGLMTGDITINPSASCLVMTTEILRNMLYRGSEIMREVAWVIFDEIHYMRDKERGVVWEETLILLPDRVRFVFLSATIPNAREFALWVAKLHKQPCTVVYTDFRPTPLQHYLFPAGAEGLYLVVDDKGVFREDNFAKAMACLGTPEAENKAEDGKDGGGKKKKKKTNKPGAGTDIYKIVRMIMERHYEPVIIFSFSKRECEEHALHMSKLDFSDEEEKKLIEQIFTNAIDSLSDDDKHLPQVENILPLLKRGIGIHHGGLLPILKEVIEILFQEGLLKALFSTETFSMGLNMPAKTVVFTSVRKFDGDDFRVVSSGEYIQMSGRAGRRGLDDKGIVICMLDEQLQHDVARDMIKGASDPLNSSFHLGYNMLLNLLRVEEADPEYMMARSFRQFQMNRNAPKLQEKLEGVEKEKNAIVLKDPQGLAEYYHIRSQLDRAARKMREVMTQPINVLPFLNPGRLVKVSDTNTDWGWGVLVNFQKKNLKKEVSIDGSGATYIVDVLLECNPDSIKPGRKNIGKPQPPAPGKTGEWHVIPILLSLVEHLSSVRLYVPQDLKPRDARANTGRMLREAQKRFPDGLPRLDPVEDMKINDEAFTKIIRKVETLEDRLMTHKWHKQEDLKEQYALFEKRLALESQANQLRADIKNASTDVVLRQQLKYMKRVLRRLGHVTEDNVVTMKGRVAGEISTCDELLGTELIFGGVFNELTPEQTCALASCLVFDEKSDETPKVKDDLQAPLRALQDAATRVAKVVQDARLPIDPEEYVKKFGSNMMDLVYAWCRGAKFSELCKMTDIFEGTIIRCMRRLEELLRQFAMAAKQIGNAELETKFNDGINKLKRDIVFAASLYL